MVFHKTDAFQTPDETYRAVSALIATNQLASVGRCDAYFESDSGLDEYPLTRNGAFRYLHLVGHQIPSLANGRSIQWPKKYNQVWIEAMASNKIASVILWQVDKNVIFLH